MKKTRRDGPSRPGRFLDLVIPSASAAERMGIARAPVDLRRMH